MGALVGNGRFIWLFALFGLATTAYTYWNSAKLSIRAMKAQPVTPQEQPHDVPDRRGAVEGEQADAAALRLADHGAERLRHRPQPGERGGLLHPGH